MHSALRATLGTEHSLIFATGVEEAVRIVQRIDIDGAIIDINLNSSDGDGTDFLSSFKKRFPEKPALIQSGKNDIPTVVKCIQLGADDYLEKPYSSDTLRMKLEKVFRDMQQRKVLRRHFERSQTQHQIIGTHPLIVAAKTLVERAATMRILLIGETGVGKTPFAWYSNHVVSQIEKKQRAFEQLNCSCLSTEQFQDQMFGHKKGAFTGAIADKRGLVDLAQGGDLFLDEIGEMPLDVQSLFLTFLDSMEYYRLGDDQKRKADVRIISATNRNLRRMVDEGKFRKDLFSRISQIVVNIPPLRDRNSDIPQLFEYYVRSFTGSAKPYNPAIISLFESFTWEEGNVRELRDSIEYACIMARSSPRIELDHLSDRYRPLGADALAIDSHLAPTDLDHVIQHGLESYLGKLERDILLKCLNSHNASMDALADKRRLNINGQLVTAVRGGNGDNGGG